MLKPQAQFAAEFTQVNAFYAASEGLQRPGGMVRDGACDVEAIIAWGYGLMAGMSVPQVLAQIRRSDEWKTKHPGETPPPPPATSRIDGPLRIDG